MYIIFSPIGNYYPAWYDIGIVKEKGNSMTYTKKQILAMYIREAFDTGVTDNKSEAKEYAKTMFEVDFEENSIVKVGRHYQLANQLI